MTLAMPDSINVNDLPPGYDAYLGYTDGQWATGVELARKFLGAQLVLLTVTGGAAAHGIRVSPGTDVEPGDVTAATAAAWISSTIEANPSFRPVLYASVEGALGYGMHDILAELPRFGVSRGQVRLLSAHYAQGPHICGPRSCGVIDEVMDGTQWTSTFLTKAGGRNVVIDMSMLADDFFTGSTGSTGSTGLNRTERLVQELGTVQRGMTGGVVRTVQGLCNARWPDGNALIIDGIFGIGTLATVRAIQRENGITEDGIVGPQTWPVLLGVA